MTGSVQDGRLLRGDQSRRLILKRTIEIASLEGLGALSLGRIAGDLGISKSGVFNLFGSMEELQLATVRAADQIYSRSVIEPAMDVPIGCGRVWALCAAYLDYLDAKVFPGGCFFFSVNAEFDSQPGRVRDLVKEISARWCQTMETAIREAQTLGELSPDITPEQLAFELIALLSAANGHCLLHDDPRSYAWARTAILGRLGGLVLDPVFLPDVPDEPLTH